MCWKWGRVLTFCSSNTTSVDLPNELSWETLIKKLLSFFFRYAVIKDGEVEKVFESRYPEIVSEINSVSTKVDFGQLTNEQELVIKITIAIYRHS